MPNEIIPKKERIFTVGNPISLLSKYKRGDKSLTVYLTDGKVFTGKLRWHDDYAIKLIMPDRSGSITIPIHNIAYYSCEHFLLDREVEKPGKVNRGKSISTDREREQLRKYKKNKELLHFYLKDGIEVRGRLQWYLEYVYAVKPDGSNVEYMITKRYIMYYRKIELL